ncbi:MAG: hypothetical protein ACRCVX_03880, partial [Shewanella sp.]
HLGRGLGLCQLAKPTTCTLHTGYLCQQTHNRGKKSVPIRPENKARYPKNWKQIADAIRVRSGQRCEGSPAYPDCRAVNGEPHPVTDSKVVLTVAHLDHTPENCDDENLKAMCQRCHLTYDLDHHRKTAYATRKAAAMTAEIF